MNRYFLFLLPFIFLVSCTEKYPLRDVENQTIIVVEGCITNERGPYFIRISESTSNLLTGETSKRAIDDAKLIITDDKGNRDELQALCNADTDSVRYYEYDLSKWYLVPDYEQGFIHYEWENYEAPQGYYYTTKIEGIPGNTYTLEVTYNGQTYTATDKMPHGAVLDSISLEPVGIYIYDKPDGDDGFDVPCLYFSEPQDEVNFYMFNYITRRIAYKYDENDNRYYPYSVEPNINMDWLKDFQHDDIWRFSIVSDRFLPSEVEKYKLSQGDSPLSYINGTDEQFSFFHDFDGFATFMWNISEPAYRYFFALSQQYYDDGGAFKPAPASPPTNLSNGAQGFFFASSVSYYMLKNDTPKY
jgi:hypothetical protein